MQARRLALFIAVLALGLVGPAGAAPTVKVAFLQGEQMVTVNRPGSTVQEALEALIAGPTAAETKRGFRTYVPPDSAIRSATVAGNVATVDLNQAFIKGNDADSTLARLAQVVKTTTSVPGIKTVKILVAGGVPLGLFPGINATVPLTPEAFATPNVAPPKPEPDSGKPANESTRTVQQQLAALGYLLPADIDGKPGPATLAAVIAFQKWQGLQRDGTAGPATLRALASAKRPTPVTRGGAGRRVEVLLDRQLVLAIQDDVVVRALHVSTGKASTPTPPGSFRIYGKYARWWSVPFRDWLLWAAPFNGGIAMHQYPDVPVYPASHGCVRVPESNARWLYDFNSVGESVKVLTSSR